MKRKKLLKESENNIIIKIIGDHIANLLDGSDNYLTSGIYDRNMGISELILKLKTEEPQEDVDYLILSIGAEDYFSKDKFISYLCDLIFEVYPNAEYYVIEGFLDVSESGNFDDDEYNDLQKQKDNFYGEFLNNGFKLIETNTLFSDEVLEPNSSEILSLEKEISLITVNEINLDGNELEDESEVEISEPSFTMDNSDDKTDFDTIYEFLERFEKIVKSKNVYSIKTSTSYNPNVHQIETALRFLLPNYVSSFKNDGVFDNETEEAIRTFQVANGMEPSGIADPETIEEMFYDLKTQGFDEEDLGKFLDMIDTGDVETIHLNGKVDYSKAGLSGTKLSNVKLLINYMIEAGITNPYTQIGILSVCGKECGFEPQDEICYDYTSDSRIKEVFGTCRTNDAKIKSDWKAKYGDNVTITILKDHCEDFFDAMYGPQAKLCLGWDTGNDNPGDGYRYRGRGFNGLTFKSSYSKYGGIIGEDLVSSPEKVNDLDTAAKVAVAFFTKGKTPPQFISKEEATNYFVNINAGGSSAWSESFENAHAWMNKFDVIP